MYRKKVLTDEFLDFESRMKLFELNISGFLIWDYIRYNVYLELIGKKKKTSSNTSLKSNLTNSVRLLLKSILNVIFQPKKYKIKLGKDIVFLGHPRKTFDNGSYVDKYCDDIISSLKDKYSVSMLDLPFKLEHFKTIDHVDSSRLDSFEHMLIFAPYLRRIRLTEDERNRIQQIESELQKQFNVFINLSKHFLKGAKRYKSLKIRAERSFDKGSPKCLVCVDGYNFIKKVFVQVANERNIPTIELQHGTVGYFHLAYRYPSINREMNSLPNYLFLWGEYWENFIQLPKGKISKVVGFPYLEKRYQPSSKMNNKILVISQWTIGFDLLKEVHALAKEMPSYQFLFKMHPNEENSRKTYQDLIQVDNVKIVPPKSELYDLFNESIAQIGVYSTALIEGIAFKLKTYIIPLYGHEAFDDLVKAGIMHKTNDVNLITASLNSDDQSAQPIKTIWENDALNKSVKEIERIINES